MAVNINSVYQKVLALSNKEQRGYITPQEFNLLADMAQNDIYENYFHQARNSNAKIKDDDTHTDTLEMIEDKLAPFVKYVGGGCNSQGIYTLPTDIYKIIIAKLGLFVAEEVNQRERSYILALGNNLNSKLKPMMSRPIYTRTSATEITFSAGGIEPNETVILHYYKKPTTPSFAYVVVSDKALYDPSNSVHFELVSSEEEHLVSRILLLAGGAIKQPDLSQGAASLLQQRNQEQNS
jgi:hypothetical protein